MEVPENKLYRVVCLKTARFEDKRCDIFGSTFSVFNARSSIVLGRVNEEIFLATELSFGLYFSQATENSASLTELFFPRVSK